MKVTLITATPPLRAHDFDAAEYVCASHVVFAVRAAADEDDLRDARTARPLNPNERRKALVPDAARTVV